MKHALNIAWLSLSLVVMASLFAVSMVDFASGFPQDHKQGEPEKFTVTVTITYDSLTLEKATLVEQRTKRDYYLGRVDIQVKKVQAAVITGRSIKWKRGNALIFYGTAESPQLQITFDASPCLKTQLPLDSAAKIFVGWVNQYHDWYVQALKDTVQELRSTNKRLLKNLEFLRTGK